MLNLFKKSNQVKLYSPVNGKRIDLSKVKDRVFSSKMMGDGLVFQFEEDTLYSPCDGQVTLVYETLHAYGFRLDNGAEVLLHIGMDTVNLNGEGFTSFVKQGQKVKVGDPIVKIDLEFMKEKGIDLTTPMILTNGSNFEYTICLDCENVKAKTDVVVEFK